MHTKLQCFQYIIVDQLLTDNGTTIIKSFNHHLRSIKKVAEERGSDIMDSIYLLPLRGDNVTPFYKIANDVFYDTIPFRRKDNQDSAFLSHYRKKKRLRAQNFRKDQQAPKISDQKRQILISNAFKKLYNTESLSQDQAVEIRLDNSNFDNSPPPQTQSYYYPNGFQLLGLERGFQCCKVS
jgi:hypothetical protein